MVLLSSENTSDDSLSKEIRQKQRKEQTSSPECQKYKKKNDTSKINALVKHGTQLCRLATSILFSHRTPKDYSKDKTKSKPMVYNWCGKAPALKLQAILYKA